ncbi:MAG: DUF1905 domain-containing protein [Candidatus Yonathbacteria bacterium]|nr:DUF1905 domain-containing protein [Candidatus Yonathbacteria bacterium]
MKKSNYRVGAKVWIYPSETAQWHFVNVPKKESIEITKNFGGVLRGWGSLPVSVTIGKTTWITSIFSDKRSGCYLLPIKSKVREKEGILVDDNIVFTFKIFP